jgi:hypothetical protein
VTITFGAIGYIDHLQGFSELGRLGQTSRDIRDSIPRGTIRWYTPPHASTNSASQAVAIAGYDFFKTIGVRSTGSRSEVKVPQARYISSVARRKANRS